MSKFKLNDIVYVANPDQQYEEDSDYIRTHSSFFGKVSDMFETSSGTYVNVEFSGTAHGGCIEWCYHEDELGLASDLKNMTLEDFSNTFGVIVMAEYICATPQTKYVQT